MHVFIENNNNKKETSINQQLPLTRTTSLKFHDIHSLYGSSIAWNNLPKDVVHAGSFTLFRNRLRTYMNID